jgi:D-alanine-D-alanine ligase
MIELPEVTGIPPDGEIGVAVICGGTGSEGDVSRASGQAVFESLEDRFATVRMLEPDADLIDRLRAGYFDVVFPVMHGPGGEDGTLQGLLEMLGLPYVGCGVLAGACGMDKVVAKQLFRASGLPLAAEVVVDASVPVGVAATRIVAELGADLVVKPAAEGSAVGVAFAHGAAELEAALSTAGTFGREVLVEELVAGAEITVGVIETDEPVASPPVEVRTPEGSWYDYEHRYTAGLSEHVIPAAVPGETAEQVRRVAVAAHEALRCRDLSRVDFVVGEEGRVALLEVNTMPGMTPTSLFPDAMGGLGLDFVTLTSYLVRRALARGSATSSSAA